ncbi:WxL domain-containing protein [Candidatus Enterococcus clewellii]|uniref:WxL domain-containing protein n=1 Tax=Candidatus Enterococcus clewellii TaxID=1834193 RepID=A0AAQ3VXT1_9ENTE
MKIRNKVSIFLAVVLSLALVFFFNSGSSIRANEDVSESSTNESSVVETVQSFDPSSALTKLPQTEESLRSQEEITNDELDGLMSGTAYQSSTPRATGEISGSMTLAQHKAEYEASYRAASDAYHAAHGFDPESGKVVTVDTYTSTTSSANSWGYGFVQAYSDETVTKIIMLNDISSPTSGTGVFHRRATSIEIDGGGYKLLLYRKSLGIATPAAGTYPVFHLHDMVAATETNYNSTEAAGYWSFINGDTSTTTNLRSDNWYFRFGNVSTDFDQSKYNGLNTSYTNVGGRFARANSAEVTMYGYNVLVTGSENFYLGSMIVEDNTVWKGTNDRTNYSVCWHVERQSDGSTGINGEFTIGKNAFVYLRNTTTYTSYPAVYAHYSTITVGEGSYYNASMQGRALSNYAALNGTNRYAQKKFVAKEGSHINLLSRGSGPVVRLTETTNGTTANMEFLSEQNSEVFIYGNTSDGVIQMNGSGAKFEIVSPKQFEIRNSLASTSGTSARFLTITAGNTFGIYNSDINLWRNATAVSATSDYTYEKVNYFTGDGTTFTSSNSDLQSTFVHNGFRRINGLNVAPEVVWDPVTDAQKSYQARVSLGNLPTGAFDNDGVPIMEEVFAQTGQALVTFTDTRGNVRANIPIDGNKYAKYTDTEFQIAPLEMKATATRGETWVSEETPEPVIDVTPPEPATLMDEKITNATKQLSAENLEVGANVLISINGGSLIGVGTVGSDGKWLYNLPGYLNAGDTVTIYLEDNAGDNPTTITPPSTNSAVGSNTTGNINPYPSAVSYIDAIFQPAKRYTVIDIIPDAPSLIKGSASSGGTTTSIGDEVTYTLTAKNDKADSVDWKDVVLEDVLAAGLDFDTADHGITIKQIDASGTETTIPLAADTFDYNETTRLLTIKLGDIPAKYSYVVTFKVTIGNDATVDQDIMNKATAKGYSPQESLDPFVPGPITGPFKVIDVTSDEVGLPGGTLYGILQLTSAPTVIDFKTHTVTMNDTRVEEPELNMPLTVSDSRGNLKSWTLTATLTKEMAHMGDTTKILHDAIKFNNGTTEDALDGDSTLIKTYTHPSAGDYVVSNDWSSGGTGLKLEVPAGSVRKLGQYQAEITWHLGDTP